MAALHLETKNELARELESSQADLQEQRRAFKHGLAEADQKCAALTSQLREAMRTIDALKSAGASDDRGANKDDSVSAGGINALDEEVHKVCIDADCCRDTLKHQSSLYPIWLCAHIIHVADARVAVLQ